MNDLSLVPTNDLIAELDKRFDALVVLSSRRVTKEDDITDYHINGCKPECIGLITIAQKGLINDYCSEETEGFAND